ncbi:TerD family protein [Streptomyces sp. NBC_00572]|uniref:TerD family protein n=1 Tax=Streptomyces sp. NBC_00572 TaxID=2903664 RepID=UPI002257403B|nr:TerD family protein [Streptomyces sp. NBC_00572]MCX4987043.1 TerD family protein [Streptomyces sp. NBC_00572]
MTQIIKGENLPVPGQAWRIEVVRQAAGDGVPEVAVSALLLDAADKAVGHLVLERTGAVDDRSADRLDLDTGSVGPDVRRIVIVAVGQNGTLGQVPGLSVRTSSAATGEQLALYEVDDATTETALVLGEYYRRDGGWKFRAVGEGYDEGLRALAEDFRISVPAPTQGGPVPAELPHGSVGKSAGATGPVPVELPRGAVGKSQGSPADTERGQGSGGSAQGQGQGQGQGHGGGSGLTKGEAEGHGPGSHPPHAFAQAQPGAVAQAQAPPQPRPPTRGPGAIPVVPSPAASPEAVAAVGMLGGEFDDIVYSGRGSAKFAMDTTPPPGYVLVDFARTGKGYFDLDSIDWNGREAVDLGDSATSHRFERRVMWCDNLYPLRFRVGCDDRDEWTIVIRPVSTVRELGEAATGRGSEVLLHTGPAGELVSRLRPTEATGSVRVEGHKPRRPGAPARYPDALASESGRSPKVARALPEGPLFVAVVRGEGDWSLEVRPPRSVPPQEKRSGIWRRFSRS